MASVTQPGPPTVPRPPHIRPWPSPRWTFCGPEWPDGRWASAHRRSPVRARVLRQERHARLAIDPAQEFLVQPVDASWLQCNIECQEACPVGTNCRGYLNLAAEGRFEEGYILSREPNPVAAMCSYVCSAPCERACRRGDIDRPLAIRAMKRFLVEWHEASGIPDVMPQITPRAEKRRRRRCRAGWPRGGARAGDEGRPGSPSSTACPTPAGRCSSACRRSASRARPSRWTSASSSGLASTLPVRHDDRQGHHVRAAPRDYDAIAITAGAMNAVALDIPGGDLDGVEYGVDFMKKANLGEPLEVGTDVVVIGGGYTAMDCSRTSLRHGADT